MRVLPVTYKIPMHIYGDAVKYRDALHDMEQAAAALQQEFEAKLVKLQEHYGSIMKETYTNIVAHFGYDPADTSYSVIIDMNYMAQHGEAYIQVYRSGTPTINPAADKPTGKVH